MARKLSEIKGIGDKSAGKLATLGYHTDEDVWKKPFGDFLYDIFTTSGFGEDKIRTILKVLGFTDWSNERKTVRNLKRKLDQKQIEPMELKKETSKYDRSGKSSGAIENAPSITPPPAPKENVHIQGAKAVMQKTIPTNPKSLNDLHNESPAISVETLDGNTVIKDLNKYDKTNDFEEFASGNHNWENYKNAILEVAKRHSDFGSRDHIIKWMKILDEQGVIQWSENRFTGFDYIQEPLSKAIDLTITDIEKDMQTHNPPLTDSMFRLYKVYVDAVGYNWDGDPQDGPLGMEDNDEFMRRMEISVGVDFDKETIRRAWAGYQTGTGLLLAGDPGGGKTFFAKALGNAITDGIWGSLPYSRINIHNGVEPADMLGQWDYQAQILAMSTSKIKLEALATAANDANAISDEMINELRDDLYQEQYFRFGPLTLAMIQGIPILIDEVNRANPDVQNVLLQAIDEGEVVIDYIGKIVAAPGFFPMFTINENDSGTNPLSEAFLRRVKYLMFESPENYTKFIHHEYPNWVNDKLKTDIEKIRGRLVKYMENGPSAIPPSAMSEWSQELIAMYGADVVLDRTKIVTTLGTVVKNQEDCQAVKENIRAILEGFPDSPEEAQRIAEQEQARREAAQAAANASQNPRSPSNTTSSSTPSSSSSSSNVGGIPIEDDGEDEFATESTTSAPRSQEWGSSSSSGGYDSLSSEGAKWAKRASNRVLICILEKGEWDESYIPDVGAYIGQAQNAGIDTSSPEALNEYFVGLIVGKYSSALDRTSDLFVKLSVDNGGPIQ